MRLRPPARFKLRRGPWSFELCSTVLSSSLPSPSSRPARYPDPKLTSSFRHLNPPSLNPSFSSSLSSLSLSDSSKPLSPHLPRWSRAVDSCGQNFVPNQHLVPEDPRPCWPTGTASGGAFICILSDTRKSGCFLARWGNGWDLGKLHSSSLPRGLDQMSSLPHSTWLCLCPANCKTTIARAYHVLE